MMKNFDWSLPLQIVNPFDFKYVADDLHVIAYIDRHPRYEALEAMVSFGAAGETSVRMIVTRHDQSQVDHVNSNVLEAAARGSGRETVRRNIDVKLDLDAPRPSAEIRLQSFENEPIVLRVVCASVPDPARGGLSDPGEHSNGTSLPIMVRGKSAMAGSESRVEVGGQTYPIPEKFRAGPHFVAHNGYFTVSHQMALLRAGRRNLEVLQVPTSINSQSRWLYRSDEGERGYAVADFNADDGIAHIRSDDGRETVVARFERDRLQPIRVLAHRPNEAAVGACLSLDADRARFAISIGVEPELVSGRIEGASEGGVHLMPELPAWAVSRSVGVGWNLEGAHARIQTTLGA